MKRWSQVGLLLLWVGLFSCSKPAVVPVSQALADIDTLMQCQPDSALNRLLSYYDTVEDRHYANLLLSELLYKNDYEQTNRDELLDAMAWYDSVAEAHPHDKDIAFLDARCHYMNGVGYYETDSVVNACGEYLKALEIMETHFEEKDLVGYKAKVMALTYIHLCELFSDQYLSNQTILFGKEALTQCYRYESEPWHIAWLFDKIGLHYQIINQQDSADYYFERALVTIPDTNMVIYRDVVTARTVSSYEKDKNAQMALKQLYYLLAISENESEYLSRCLSIGGIFYNESLFDSACLYLSKVFDESIRINPKKQAAEWLVEIGSSQGMNTEQYADYLVPFANLEENKSDIKSQLAELYKTYSQQRLERQHRDKIHNYRIRVSLVIIGLLLALLIIVILLHSNKKKKQNLELQIKEETLAHEIQQKALSGRLKKSNETLRKALKSIKERKASKEFEENKVNRNSLERYNAFKQTPICRELFEMVEQLHNDKRIKLKTNLDVACYKSNALSTTQLVLLSKAVDEYFPVLYVSLKERYPFLGQKEWKFCLLYLLQLDKLSICVLLQEPYHTCRRYTLKLEQAFHCKHGLPNFLLEQVL